MVVDGGAAILIAEVLCMLVHGRMNSPLHVHRKNQLDAGAAILIAGL